MNNILIFSDLHLTKESLKECILILEEIGSIAKEHNVDTLINLGDTFDVVKPSSLELDVFATFIKRINKPMIVIAANSHESESEIDSVINHYGILSDNIKVVKEYKDGNDLFLGHFIVKGAKKSFGTTHTLDELKGFRHAWLGHQHSHEPDYHQLGSCRFVSFDEWQDKKVVVVIKNYKTKEETVEIIQLKSPIPMVVLHLGQKIDKNEAIIPSNRLIEPQKTKKRGRPRKSTGVVRSSKRPSQASQNTYTVESLCDYLDKFDKNTKVKVIVNDFESYRLFLNTEKKYEEKFVRFIRENDFNLTTDVLVEKKEHKSLAESFDKFAIEKEVDKSIIEVIKNEIK